jgi:hypothetical protein
MSMMQLLNTGFNIFLDNVLLQRADESVSGYEFLKIGMPDYPASSQSRNGLTKTNDAGASPVPE